MVLNLISLILEYYKIKSQATCISLKNNQDKVKIVKTESGKRFDLEKANEMTSIDWNHNATRGSDLFQTASKNFGNDIDVYTNILKSEFEIII